MHRACVVAAAVQLGRQGTGRRRRRRPRPPPPTTKPDHHRARRRAVGAAHRPAALDGPARSGPAGAGGEDRQRRRRKATRRRPASTQADVVYEEQVEGSVTRLARRLPLDRAAGPVGPVRSARTTDIGDAGPARPPAVRLVGRQRRRRRRRARQLADRRRLRRPPAGVLPRTGSRRAPHNLFARRRRALRRCAADGRDAADRRSSPTATPGEKLSPARPHGPRRAPRLRRRRAVEVTVRVRLGRATAGRRGQNGTPHVDEDGAPDRARATSSSSSSTYVPEPGRRPALRSRGADRRRAARPGCSPSGRLVGGHVATSRRSSRSLQLHRRGTATPIELTPGHAPGSSCPPPAAPPPRPQTGLTAGPAGTVGGADGGLVD